MKIKVLSYINGCDDEYGQVMDNFVFDDTVDIKDVENKVEKVFQEYEGQIGYYDIIQKLYGDKLFDIVETREVIW